MNVMSNVSYNTNVSNREEKLRLYSKQYWRQPMDKLQTWSTGLVRSLHVGLADLQVRRSAFHPCPRRGGTKRQGRGGVYPLH